MTAPPDRIQRYGVNNEWVSYADHLAAIAALEAEVARLREALKGAETAMRRARGVIVAKHEHNALTAAIEAARAALGAGQ